MKSSFGALYPNQDLGRSERDQFDMAMRYLQGGRA